MTPRRWYAIATLIMLVAVPMLGAAQTTSRVQNAGCDQASEDPTDVFGIPGWTNDEGVPPTLTARVDGIGVDQSAACVVVGVGVLRSVAFPATGGETITAFTADVWEIRNDCGGSGTESPTVPAPVLGDVTLHATLCSEPASAGVVRGDSVVALEFMLALDTNGDLILDYFRNVGQFEMHCDAVVDARDNGVIDGSDSCTVADQYVAIEAKNDTADFECMESVDAAGTIINPSCTKYDGIVCNHVDPARNDADCVTSSRAGGCLCVAATPNPLLVPAGATYGHVLLGGSLALDADPTLELAGLNSPTSITAFDNIVVA